MMRETMWFRVGLISMLTLSLLSNVALSVVARHSQARAELDIHTRAADERSCVNERETLMGYLDESLELAVLVCGEFKRRWLACSGIDGIDESL